MKAKLFLDEDSKVFTVGRGGFVFGDVYEVLEYEDWDEIDILLSEKTMRRLYERIAADFDLFVSSEDDTYVYYHSADDCITVSVRKDSGRVELISFIIGPGSRRVFFFV